jgi:hypothetical protein
MVQRHYSCHDAAVSATVTIIATEVESLAQFKRLEPVERRRISFGWEQFPSRSGRYPDRIFRKATGTELDMLRSPPDEDYENGEKLTSFIIDSTTLEGVIPRLEASVVANAAATARALVETVGETAELSRVSAALNGGTWPEIDDAAAEAAAFAHHLLAFARHAALSGSGICWEYRGDFPLAETDA